MSDAEAKWVELPAVETLADVIETALRLRRGLLRPFWFRGHQCVDWALTPSVMRITGSEFREKMLLGAFIRSAPSRRAGCPPPPTSFDSTDPSRWVSLARQYGLPTRLLDWSESILVAMFFAVEPVGTDDEEDGALWGLDPTTCNSGHDDLKGIPLFGSDKYTQSLVRAAFESFPRKPDVVAAAAPEIDTRILVQQCNYTIHGDATALEDTGGNSVYRAVIKASAKRRIYEELRSVGIRRSTLFPDLGHLATELMEDWGTGGPGFDTSGIVTVGPMPPPMLL